MMSVSSRQSLDFVQPEPLAGLDSCAGANAGSVNISATRHVCFNFIFFSLVGQSAPRWWRRKTQSGFIPETIPFAAFEHAFATQRIAPFVFDEVTAVRIR